MAHDVFISYATEDKRVADAACAAIEARGFRCWMAPRDVVPGMPYGEAIIRGIQGCRAMVLVFSSNANTSPHIPKEIERAVTKHTPIIPFRIEDVPPADSLDYFISSLHWLDAIGGPLDGHLARLANAVEQTVAGDGLSSAKPAAESKPSRRRLSSLPLALVKGLGRLGRQTIIVGLGGMLFGVTVMAIVAAALYPHLGEKPVIPSVVRFVVEAPPGQQFGGPAGFGGGVSISPDGRYLVFAASAPGESSTLWLRPVDSVDARPLPGTDRAVNSFWSPDSKSVAFFADGKLKRIDISAASALDISDTSVDTSLYREGSWSADGTILFAGADGIYQVSSSGGQARRLITPDHARGESEVDSPQFLPDGRRFLYFIETQDTKTRGVYVSSLDHPQERSYLLPSSHKALYTALPGAGAGALLWLRDSTLMAQPFDPGDLKFSGGPVPLVDRIALPRGPEGGYAGFWTAAETGTIAYRTGAVLAATGLHKLVWFSRAGKEMEEAAPEGPHAAFGVSPDWKQLAIIEVDYEKAAANVWTYDLGRRIMTRLTSGVQNDRVPVWSPDGRYIAFASNRSGTHQIYRRDASGAGQDEQLTDTPDDKVTSDWSPDGKFIIYSQLSPSTKSDIWALPAAPDASGKRVPVPLVATQFDESYGKVSPDGRWLAYVSDESGTAEVYIRAFPMGSARWQVSSGGGTRPLWRGDSKELYFLRAKEDQMVVLAAGIRANGSALDVDPAKELFSMPAFSAGVGAPWAVSPDGQRFLTEPVVAGSDSDPPLVLANWEALLKR